MKAIAQQLRLLELAFPFYVQTDRSAVVRAFGRSLPRLCPGIAVGDRLDRHVELDDALTLRLSRPPADQDEPLMIRTSHRSVLLRCQVIAAADALEGGDPDAASSDPGVILLASPWITTAEELDRSGLLIEDFAAHDPTPEFIFLAHASKASLDDARRLAARMEALAHLALSAKTAVRQRDLAERLQDAVADLARSEDSATLRSQLLVHMRRLVGPEGVLLLDAAGGCLGPAGAVLLDESQRRDVQAWVTRCAAEPTMPLGPPPDGIRQLLGDRTDVSTLPVPSGDLGLLLVMVPQRGLVFDDAETEIAQNLVDHASTTLGALTRLARAEHLAGIDELTGLANRRALFVRLGEEFEAAGRLGNTLSVAMIDIDHFKATNDRWGHPTGDEVIRQVAQRLRAVIRDRDVIGRYGGEEFCMAWQAADDTAAVGERCRSAVADTAMQTRAGTIRVTASVGLTTVTPHDIAIDSAVARADAALYSAKKSGRNCCVVM